MKRRIFSILLTLCIVLCLAPTSVFSEGETTQLVATEQELVDALADDTVDIIKMKNDIEISSTLNVIRPVIFDLVGYMLEIKGGGSVIAVKNGGHLTLNDSDLTSTYYFTPNADGLWEWGTSGTETVHGGVIHGGSAEKGGSSTFSGLIINNNVLARFSGAYSPMGIIGEKPIGSNSHNYCTVTFDPTDGTMEHTTRYFLQGKNISSEITPPRTGYIFAGWCKADGTMWEHTNDTVTEDITLYAKWTQRTYTVTFDSAGGR